MRSADTIDVPSQMYQDAAFGYLLTGLAANPRFLSSRLMVVTASRCKLTAWIVVVLIGFGFFGLETGAQSIDSLKHAAELGSVQAQKQLGNIYADTSSAPFDLREAARWLRLSAEVGDAAAQAHLGSMYLEGKGVRRNSRQAVRWLRRAAEQEHQHAQLRLGRLYFEGSGVNKGSC